MPARNPLTDFVRRIVNLGTSADSLDDDRVGVFTNFALLPAATQAVTTDLVTDLIGSSAQSARADGGGVRISTKSSTPASGDACAVVGLAVSGLTVPITATSVPRLRTQVSLPVIGDVLFFRAGLDENITDVDPGGTAGEGAGFCYDPGGDMTGGSASDNWQIHEKIDGADTYTATEIPVEAETDYVLEISYGSDLKPRFYIDGSLVHTGSAQTSGDSVAPLIGLEKTAAATVRSCDIRYVKLSRVAG